MFMRVFMRNIENRWGNLLWNRSTSIGSSLPVISRGRALVVVYSPFGPLYAIQSETKAMFHMHCCFGATAHSNPAYHRPTIVSAIVDRGQSRRALRVSCPMADSSG